MFVIRHPPLIVHLLWEVKCETCECARYFFCSFRPYCLKLHLVGNLKISCVAPPRVTCLRTHHWLIEIGKRREEKAQLPLGIELRTSHSVIRCAATWATATAHMCNNQSRLSLGKIVSFFPHVHLFPSSFRLSRQLEKSPPFRLANGSEAPKFFFPPRQKFWQIFWLQHFGWTFPNSFWANKSRHEKWNDSFFAFFTADEKNPTHIWMRTSGNLSNVGFI